METILTIKNNQKNPGVHPDGREIVQKALKTHLSEAVWLGDAGLDAECSQPQNLMLDVGNAVQTSFRELAVITMRQFTAWSQGGDALKRRRNLWQQHSPVSSKMETCSNAGGGEQKVSYAL